MQRALAALMMGLFLLPAAGQNRTAQPAAPAQPQAITGFRDVQAEVQHEKAFLAVPDAHLHLYGKDEARPGRKMGHVTHVTVASAPS